MIAAPSFLPRKGSNSHNLSLNKGTTFKHVLWFWEVSSGKCLIVKEDVPNTFMWTWSLDLNFETCIFVALQLLDYL